MDYREYTIETAKDCPEELLKVVYDTKDDVLFGSRIVKGKVGYHYVPAEYMITGRPYIVHSSVSYDGKGNKDLPKDALIMNWKDLPSMFRDNIFTR